MSELIQSKKKNNGLCHTLEVFDKDIDGLVMIELLDQWGDGTSLFFLDEQKAALLIKALQKQFNL